MLHQARKILLTTLFMKNGKIKQQIIYFFKLRHYHFWGREQPRKLFLFSLLLA